VVIVHAVWAPGLLHTPAARVRMDPDTTLPPRTDPVQPGATLSPTPAADAPPGPVENSTFGRYRIEKKIGEGGMGAVFLARDTLLDRRVRLKVPHLTGNVEVAATRFLREARAAAGLNHPNICPIYDLGEIEGTHYLALAFVQGEPLSARMGPGRPMEPAEA